jgi:hypothetical protein
MLAGSCFKLQYFLFCSFSLRILQFQLDICLREESYFYLLLFKTMILLAFQMLSRLGKPFSLFFLSLQTQFVAMLRTNLPPWEWLWHSFFFFLQAWSTQVYALFVGNYLLFAGAQVIFFFHGLVLSLKVLLILMFSYRDLLSHFCISLFPLVQGSRDINNSKQGHFLWW